MKKMLKKHKIIILIFICLIVLSIVLVKLLDSYNNDAKAIYGNRLEGIDKVKISDTTKDDIVKNIEAVQKTDKVSVATQGKIINVTIVLKDETSRDDAKSLTDKILEKLTDEQKKYYDIQVLIKKNNDDAAFPIIGYHHHAKESFTWTLDR